MSDGTLSIERSSYSITIWRSQFRDDLQRINDALQKHLSSAQKIYQQCIESYVSCDDPSVEKKIENYVEHFKNEAEQLSIELRSYIDDLLSPCEPEQLAEIVDQVNFLLTRSKVVFFAAKFISTQQPILLAGMSENSEYMRDYLSFLEECAQFFDAVENNNFNNFSSKYPDFIKNHITPLFNLSLITIKNSHNIKCYAFVVSLLKYASQENYKQLTSIINKHCLISDKKEIVQSLLEMANEFDIKLKLLFNFYKDISDKKIQEYVGEQLLSCFTGAACDDDIIEILLKTPPPSAKFADQIAAKLFSETNNTLSVLATMKQSCSNVLRKAIFNWCCKQLKDIRFIIPRQNHFALTDRLAKEMSILLLTQEDIGKIRDIINTWTQHVKIKTPEFINLSEKNKIQLFEFLLQFPLSRYPQLLTEVYQFGLLFSKAEQPTYIGLSISKTEPPPFNTVFLKLRELPLSTSPELLEDYLEKWKQLIESSQSIARKIKLFQGLCRYINLEISDPSPHQLLNLRLEYKAINRELADHAVAIYKILSDFIEIGINLRNTLPDEKKLDINKMFSEMIKKLPATQQKWARDYYNQFLPKQQKLEESKNIIVDGE